MPAREREFEQRDIILNLKMRFAPLPVDAIIRELSFGADSGRTQRVMQKRENEDQFRRSIHLAQSWWAN